jgi:hypothetical protein
MFAITRRSIVFSAAAYAHDLGTAADGDEMVDDRSVDSAQLRRRMTTHPLARAVSIGVLGIALLDPCSVRAQSTSDPSRSEPASQSGVTAADHDDAGLALAEPEFRDLNLPLTLRLPLHGSSFQLTPRLNGNLRQGSVTGNANNLFGYSPALGFGRFEYGRPLGEGQAVAQGRDGLLNGALIGAALGAGIGVAVTHGVRDSDLVFRQYAQGALVFAAMGAGVGVGIDALFNRVSSGPTVTPRRVLIAPAVWRDFAGVTAKWRW